MRDLLRGYGAAIFETAKSNGTLSSVVSDLTGFSRVLADSDPLRNALTDASLGAQTRRDILVDLIGDKAQAETIALLSFAVRYERPAELPSAITALVLIGEIAITSEELEPPASHAGIRERVRGYAERILQELSSTNEIDQVEDDLFRFARILDDNPPLRRALQDATAPYEQRAGIVRDLLHGRSHAATQRLAAYVMRAGRIRDLVGTFERLVELAAAERGRRVADVRSAVDLDEAERQRLSVALSRMVERPVDVRVIHDPDVIGGVLVSVGDLVIDGTVRIRFERLRDLLAQAS